ncbi:MAG: antibiotic biosynthesis monooxygenase [Bacteroidetes bacterium]|nr:antibiotic biosynthesis monooxygenase [Bacteroidota bacterium]
MITRIVKMSFREEEIDAFKEIFERSKDNIRAFPGNRHVEMLQDVHHPGICFTYSWWDSEESLNAYRNSELFETTWAATKVLFNAKPEAWSTLKQGEGQL